MSRSWSVRGLRGAFPFLHPHSGRVRPAGSTAHLARQRFCQGGRATAAPSFGPYHLCCPVDGQPVENRADPGAPLSQGEGCSNRPRVTPLGHTAGTPDSWSSCGKEAEGFLLFCMTPEHFSAGLREQRYLCPVMASLVGTEGSDTKGLGRSPT